MRRSSIQVREATVDDIDTVITFADQVRGLPGARRPAARPVAPIELRDRYEALLTNPDRRVVLAVGGDGEQALGMAVLSVDVAGELLDVPVIRVSHLVVDRAHRRQGAGRALVAAAGSYADEVGVEHVTVGAATTDREANRFLARLGFAPVVVRRVAPLAVLRRHLAVPETDAAPTHVVRRRRAGVRGALTRSPLGRAEA
jgi:GNAT superfamily N-acetyltransferase